MKAIIFVVLALILFAGAFAGSWMYIQSTQPEVVEEETKEDEDEEFKPVPQGNKKGPTSVPIGFRSGDMTVDGIMRLNEEMQKQEQQLRLRAQELDRRERQLNILQKDIDREKSELDALSEKIQARIVTATELLKDVEAIQTKLDDNQDDATATPAADSTAKVLGQMTPDKAVKVIETMVLTGRTSDAIATLDSLSATESAAILDQLDSATATTLISEMKSKAQSRTANSLPPRLNRRRQR